MKFKIKLPSKFWQITILVVWTICLRTPQLPWGLKDFDRPQPDEKQHIGIAMNYLNIIDPTDTPQKFVTDQWNLPGLGTQLAWLAFPLIKIFKITHFNLYLLARLLSLAYSVLLVVLVYLFALNNFKNGKSAFLAALFLSTFDLTVTYGHYGVPDIAHAFWAYLGIFLNYQLFRLYRVGEDALNQQEKFLRKWLLLVVPLAAAAAMSYRFDFIPLATSLFCLLALAFQKKISRGDLIFVSCIFLAQFFGYLYLLVGMNFNLKDFIIIRQKLLIKENLQVVGNFWHYLSNPLQYFLAATVGTSFPFLLAFLAATFFIIKKETAWPIRRSFLFLSGIMAVYFIFLWLAPSTFVRRAIIFLPYLALYAGWGLGSWLNAPSQKIGKALKITVIVLIFCYTLGITSVQQSYFIWNPGDQVSRYLHDNFPEKTLIAYSNYAASNTMPAGINLKDFSEKVDVIVLHESYYSRYWKSFTTPFRIPASNKDVYHGQEKDRELIQNLFNNRTNYRLVKKFNIKYFFPERQLFKALFGSYETFLGDFLVFEKIPKPTSQPAE